MKYKIATLSKATQYGHKNLVELKAFFVTAFKK